MKVVKIFTFDSSHLLDGHDGKCKNLHGHTYKLEVEISGDLIADGPKEGMVLDFGDVKNVVKQYVLDRMDHAFLYNRLSEREKTIASLLEGWGLKTYALEQRTTAEVMSYHIFQILQQQGLPVTRVRLWETPTSYSEYEV
ncbi:6-carboxytetrahydropterin synthase QueD [Pelistega europaea]|uniref:6-carboxy-5,6,7,8-tetrahydropterin synthase n=1 Tax=Pelistega europaea TaxID=106147 RepID=A0A7Y4P5S0_9BURK|nr:6-carboxytetrahydropterin synthase QueD [Pelistega europaea]NOL49154.1 6-carboxytetrahydropterin synthase QueD [Pelistega europaea]